MRLQIASGNIPSIPYPVRNVILRWSSINKTSSPLSFCFPIPHRVKSSVAKSSMSLSPMDCKATTATSEVLA